MAVTTQVLQTDFSEGLDEGVDALTLQSPKLLRADNVLFTNKGSLKKRFGYDKYNTYLTNTVSNPNRIFTHNDSLCVTDDTRLWSLDESAISGNRFVSVADNQSQPLITRKAIKHHSNIITGYDSIICVPAANAAAKYEASYTMSVYDPNNLYRELSISVKDLVSGSNRAAQITTISLGFMRMSMAFSNNLLLIVYINTSTNAIDGYYLDLSSNITTITAITNLVTDVAAITYGGLDLLAVSNGFLMSYCCNDGASRLKTVPISATAPPVAGTGFKTTEANYICAVSMDWEPTTNQVWCAYNTTAASVTTAANKCISFHALTLANIFTPVTLNLPLGNGGLVETVCSFSIGTVKVNSTTALVIVSPSNTTLPDYANPTRYYQTAYRTITSAGTLVNPIYKLPNISVSSMPFVNGSKVYCCLETIQNEATLAASLPNNTTLLADLRYDLNNSGGIAASIVSPENIVGVIAPRQSLRRIGEASSAVFTYTLNLPHVSNYSSGVYTIPLAVGNDVTSLFALIPTELDIVTIDFTGYKTNMTAKVGNKTYFSGGVPMYYDGSANAETSFYSAADSFTLVDSGDGIGPTAGTYSYVLVFSVRDTNNNVVYSDTSLPKSITTGGNNSVKIAFTVPSITNHGQYETAYYATNTYPERASYEIYRTLASGTVHHLTLVGNLAPTTSFVTGTRLDSNADTVIASRPILYTTGGYLSNQIPPSFTHLIAHKERLWGIGDDQKTVWFSKRTITGISAEFNDALTFTVTDGTDPITTLAGMDEKLIIFKPRSIYYILGDGPTDTGTGSDLTSAQKIVSDVGCSNPRSLVTIPQGIMFQSNKGISLLTRSLETVWIGDNVQNTLAAYPIITSAVLDEKLRSVFFTALAAENSNTGVVLVYDYYEDKWAVHKISYNGNATQGAISACLWRGNHTMLFPDGTVYVQNKTKYTDDTAWVPMDVETAWIKPAGLQGYPRITDILLLTQKQSSDHTLTVTVDYDYNTYNTQTQIFSSAAINGLQTEQFRTVPVKQEVQALKLRFTDSAGLGGITGTGQGCFLTGLLLNVADNGGANRLPPVAQG